MANGDDDSTVGNQDDNPAAPPSAIQGSINAGQTTDVSDRPATPARKPSFFKGIITSLGLALAQGAKAGVQAPMSPQGPAIAAQTAIEAPQKAVEQKQRNQAAMTSQQQADLNVAMTQLKIHQLTMITSKMDEDAQDAVYNTGRDALTSLMDKGKADILGTGDYAAVTQLFKQKQADATAAGQGLLPIQILPSVGSSAKKPQYSLVMVGKDKLTSNWDETWGADDIGVPSDDFKAAGLANFKFHAAAGMDQQKALQLYASQHLQWVTKSTQALSAWKRTQAQQEGATDRAQDANDMRLKIAQLNNSTRRAIAATKGASDQTDKELISASKGLVAANKALGDAQGKIGNKAWSTLGGGDAREIATKRRARDQAQAVFDGILAKKAAGKGIEDMNKPAAVPKGTIATKPIVQQYLQKAGGDVAKTRKMLQDDGYTIPKAQ